MPSYAYIRASNDTYSPPYIPVVVVFGGTSGIGRAMTRRLAEMLEGRIRVVVVGRNRAAAEELFASLPTPSIREPECGYEFLPCDITLLSNIHSTARQITLRYPKINYLILTSGAPSFGPRRMLTSEGLERQLVLRYYWKVAVIHDLLPNLLLAKKDQVSAGGGKEGEGGKEEAAGVFVVLGGGFGPKIDFDDLSVEKRYWWGVGPILWGVSYGDLMLSIFATKNPAIAFTHQYPGLVDTPANSPSAASSYFIKLLLWLIRPLALLCFIKVEVSAEYMVYGLLNGEKGLYQRGVWADDCAPSNMGYGEGEKEVFWEHCVHVMAGDSDQPRR